MGTLSVRHRFVRPDAHAAAAIRQMLEELPIHDERTPAIDTKSQWVGTLSQILPCVMGELEHDYDETQTDASEGGYQFDYAISSDGYLDCELAILTRLFHRESPATSTTTLP